jgi:hypothetical protein
LIAEQMLSVTLHFALITSHFALAIQSARLRNVGRLAP